MRKPDENLDDYVATPAPVISSEPPRVVSLRRTGEVEVLKPLVRTVVPAELARTTFRAFRPRVPHQPLWFRRFVAVGSGALVITAFVLVSAILVGINDPTAGTDVATNEKPDENRTQSEEPVSFEVSSPGSFAPATVARAIVRPTAKRRVVRPRVDFTPNRPRSFGRPLQLAEPKFVPTTLIIYSDNGVIKTRIEPWLQSG